MADIAIYQKCRHMSQRVGVEFLQLTTIDIITPTIEAFRHTPSSLCLTTARHLHALAMVDNLTLTSYADSARMMK